MGFGIVLATSLAVDADVTLTGKIDDWQYSDQTSNIPVEPVRLAGEYATTNVLGQTHSSIGTAFTAGLLPAGASALFLFGSTPVDFGTTAQSAVQTQQQLGYSAGGAKDVNNFRDNIENGYLPLTSDISYEGLFYEYYFDTGRKQVCGELFCPSYSKGVSRDPFSNETEHFTTVGLNSNIEASEFERKKLNLVIAMDTSGSMGSGFNNYYYDRYGNRREIENPTGKSKMTVAKESLQGLTEHLGPEDRVGVVLFDNNAQKAKPLNKVKQVDMNAIRSHISEINAGGGTNMDAGMRKASQMLEKYESADASEYENRVIFMTDAMPNIGRTSDEGLLHMTEENAQKGIHTSFVGMGVDFNTELIDAITGVRGANYFSVHSSKQFKDRMDRDFKYMVTPLVYNLTLRMDSDAYSIEKVYGSTAAEESTGRLMRINTLFPSRSEDGQTKGGVALVKLDKKDAGSIELEVTYENREGKTMQNTQQIDFGNRNSQYFENTGVRKAIVLSRYGELMKSWIKDGRSSREVRTQTGLDERSRYRGRLGRQERQSVPLFISDEYREKMRNFRQYLESEKEAIGDQALQQEIDMTNTILES